MELTLAESVLLLALDDAKGSTGFTSVDPGLAGALLVDLGRLGALRPEGKELRPVPGVGIEHPVLARAYTAIATSSKPRSAKSWVGRLPSEFKPLTGTLAGPLVERGILTEQRSKVLGLLEPLSLVEPLVERSHRREAKKRAKEIADRGIAGSAVSDAVRDIHAAVTVAVIVPVISSGGG